MWDTQKLHNTQVSLKPNTHDICMSQIFISDWPMMNETYECPNSLAATVDSCFALIGARQHSVADSGVHRIGKEQKAHSFDLFDAAATRRNARAPTAAMLLARSSQPDQ